MTPTDLFDILFTRDAPAGQLWVWGNAAHLVYMAVGLAVIVLALRYLRALPAEHQTMALRVLAVAVFLVWIVPPALMCVTDTGERWIDHLPLHLCTSAAILIPIGLLRMSPLLLNYGFALALPAAVAAIVFPGEMFRRLSSFGVHYFLHNVAHVIPVIACLAPIVMGLWRPRWRYFLPTVGIGLALMAVAYPVNKVTGSNYFFVNWAERGTILEAFANLFGNTWYVAVLAVVATGVIAAMFGVWSGINALTTRRRPPLVAPTAP
ncbi:MAG: YwaF family protein [Bifidobacteriaceae bacterium]|jgi:uncharacterized membrane protein YwaF|nr:YwaF family protein [Bifidobacteriaceae bacterium]